MAPLWLNILEAEVKLFLLYQKPRHPGVFLYTCTQKTDVIVSLCIMVLTSPPFGGIMRKKYSKREVWPTLMWEEKRVTLFCDKAIDLIHVHKAPSK